MRIAVIGTGYVGLVTGTCLAELGHEVVCVDTDPAKVEAVNSGTPPIHEQGLEELLRRNVGDRLTATTDVTAAVRGARLSLIAVGTPFDGSAIDVGYIEGAARDIGTALADHPDHHVVVVKSTVVPGTTDEVVAPIVAATSGRTLGEGFGVAMNPEFLREGSAVADFMAPDRIVYGASDDASLAVLDELYDVFGGVDRIRTSARTAEMIKYAANSLLATLISFSNEIANLCTAVGDVDVVDVLAGVHLDRRLSPVLDDGERITPAITTYLEAGPGFGGSCFPKDVKALIAHGRAVDEPMALLQSVVDINEAQPARMVALVRRHLPELTGRRVAVLGLAFKPGTDDVRESPSLPIVRELVAAGADVVAWDPIAVDEARHALDDVTVAFTDDLATALDGADAVLLVTSWPALEQVPALLGEHAPDAVVVDGRRVLAVGSVPTYEGIGR